MISKWKDVLANFLIWRYLRYFRQMIVHSMWKSK